MHVKIGSQRHEVVTAALELYHTSSPEADWNLELALAGSLPRLLASGTAPTPVLPGPTRLELHFVDDPAEIEVDGERGIATSSPDPGNLTVEAHGAEIRVHGTVPLLWNALREGGGTRTIELAIAVTVTLRAR